MTHYITKDWEDNVECPYDKTHMIRVKRMPYHIMECRKNHPHMEMVQCPFNATHVVPKAEERYHIKNCPNKAVIEQDVISMSQRKKAKQEGEYIRQDNHDNNWCPPSPEEDWDSEENTDFKPFMWNLHMDGEHYTKSGALAGQKPPTALFQQQLPNPHTTPMVLLHNNKARPNEHRQQARAANAPASSVFRTAPPRPDNDTAKLQQIARGRGSVVAPQHQQPPAVGRGSTTAAPMPIYTMPGIGRGNPQSNIQPAPVPKPTPETKAPEARPAQPARMAAAIPGLGRPAGAAPQGVKSRAATATPAFTLGAMGRGVGRGQAFSPGPGQPQFVVPNVNTQKVALTPSAKKVEPAAEAVAEGSDEDTSISQSMSDCSLSSDDQASKKTTLRKLGKKMREIEVLEARLLSGKQLNVDEMAKLGQKMIIQQQIDSFGIEQ